MQSLPCRQQENKEMKATNVVNFIALATSLISASAIEVKDEKNETKVLLPSEKLTLAEPQDNGMAVGETPDIELSGTSEKPLLKSISDIITDVPAVVDAVFPENHNKNFTGSPYLGTIESPPFLNTHNKYHQQYKEYYAQKNKFMSTKPIKFEHDTYYNRYVGKLQAGDVSSSGSELNFRNKHFPYNFEESSGASQDEYHTHSTVDENIKDEKVLDSSFSTEETHLPSSAHAGEFQESPFTKLFGSYGKKESYPHGHRTEVSKKEQSGGWKKIVRLLTTVIPFGLLFATLSPNVLYINTTEDNRPSRLRSLDETEITLGKQSLDPLVQIVENFGGLEAMNDPICEDRFFCEMSLLGKNGDSNIIEKGFWFIANETPDEVAQEVGMKELFKAIRTNSCSIYDCQPKHKPPAEEREILEKIPKSKPKKMKKFIRT